MRNKGSINTKNKYLIRLCNEEGDILSVAHAKSYKHIVELYPVFNHEDNVRAFIRQYSHTCKTKKTKRKYGNFSIEKVEKVKKINLILI